MKDGSKPRCDQSLSELSKFEFQVSMYFMEWELVCEAIGGVDSALEYKMSSRWFVVSRPIHELTVKKCSQSALSAISLVDAGIQAQ